MRNLKPYSWRKTIPEEVVRPALLALKHYPELQTKTIEFKYTRKAGTSIMKAQPNIKSVIRVSEERSYIIYINRTVKLDDELMQITELPEKVLVGWLGHELGHVMDYESNSNWGLIWFGLGYLFSNKFIKSAERRADEIAVKHGMGEHILATKNFILNHAGLSDKYKQKIKKYYLSPEQIMEVIKGEAKLEAVTP